MSFTTYEKEASEFGLLIAAAPVPGQPMGVPDPRVKSYKEFGVEPITEETLQRYKITRHEFDQFFKSARDQRSLQKLLVKFLERAMEMGLPISNAIRDLANLEGAESQTVVDKILARLTSIVSYVAHRFDLSIPFPRAVAEGALREHRGIVGRAPEQVDGLTALIPETAATKLTDKELMYLRIGRSDLKAGVTEGQGMEAVARLHGKNLLPLSEMGKDEKDQERTIRSETKALAINDRRQIVYKYLVALRNAKIKAHGKLAPEDVNWLGASPDKVMDKANRACDEYGKKDEAVGGAVGETDYDTVATDVESFMETFRKLGSYIKIKETAPGVYDAENPILRGDISKLREFDEPEIPETLREGIEAEMDKLTKQPAYRDVLKDMVDLVDQRLLTPEELGQRYSNELAQLKRFKLMRDRKKGDPFALTQTSEGKLTESSRFLRTMQLDYMAKLRAGQTLPDLDGIIKRTEDKIAAAADLGSMQGRGETKAFEDRARRLISDTAGAMTAVREGTDVEHWEGFIDLMRELYSRFRTLFEEPDVVEHLKPLWDKGADWMHATGGEEIDRGFSNIFDKEDSGVALSQSVKYRDPALFLGYVAHSPLLRYMVNKFKMLKQEPLKHLKGPSFDETKKEIESFTQGTSRALSNLNPTTIRRKAVNKILDKRPSKETSKKAVWEFLRAAAKVLSPGEVSDLAKGEQEKFKQVREKYDEQRRQKDLDLVSLKKPLKGLLKEEGPEQGHFRKRPSKLLGQVTLKGFFDKPDHVKNFVKAIKDRSDMFLKAAVTPTDPKAAKRTQENLAKYDKDRAIDGIVAEVLGAEEKNIDDKILTKRFTTMMDERLEKQMGEVTVEDVDAKGKKSTRKIGLFDLDDKSGKTGARIEKERAKQKIADIQSKYLPKLEAMAQILDNPFPAIKDALEYMTPEDRAQYEEAIGQLQNLPPEEREKAQEVMESKAEALGLMKQRFLSKNVLAPLMEGTLKKKPGVSDEEYKAWVNAFKVVIEDKATKKDEDESSASFEAFKKKLDESIGRLFSPQGYMAAIVNGIDTKEWIQEILNSDPVKYDFNPRDREELMTRLIKHHTALNQVIDAHRKKMSEQLKNLQTHHYEDKKERKSKVREWQMEERAVNKLDMEIGGVRKAIREVEQHYHEKVKGTPVDQVLARVKDILSMKVQAPAITFEFIKKITDPDAIEIYDKKLENYKGRIQTLIGELQGYRRRLVSMKWDESTISEEPLEAMKPGEPRTKKEMIAELQSAEKNLEAQYKSALDLSKALRKREVELPSTKKELSVGLGPKVVMEIDTAKTVDDVRKIYEGLRQSQLDAIRFLDLLHKAVPTAGGTKEAGKVITRGPEAPETVEPQAEPAFQAPQRAPEKRTDTLEDKKRDMMPVLRKELSKAFPAVDWSELDVAGATQTLLGMRGQIYPTVQKLIDKLDKIIGDDLKAKKASIQKQLDHKVTDTNELKELHREYSELIKNKDFSTIQEIQKDITDNRMYDDETQKKVTTKVNGIVEKYLAFNQTLAKIIKRIEEKDPFGGLKMKAEPYQPGSPGQYPRPAVPVAPGMVKTAAIEDVPESDPETALRELTPAPESDYDETKTHLKELKMLEYLFEGAKEKITGLENELKAIEEFKAEDVGDRGRRFSILEGVKKITKETRDRVEELKRKMQNLGKLQEIKVDVAGKDLPLKEVPGIFDQLTDEYFDKYSQARTQKKMVEKRIVDAKKRMGEIEKYYDPETGKYTLSDVEKRSIMDIFYQALYWAMQSYWMQQLGKGTSEGGQDVYFGERTEVPFSKVYETLKVVGKVKSNPVYKKLLKNADTLLRADIDDTRHRTMKGAFLGEMKRLEKRWDDLGYTDQEKKWAKGRNPYKYFQDQVEYLDTVRKEQNRIYKMLSDKATTDVVTDVYDDIIKRVSDPKMKATMEKQWEVAMGRAKVVEPEEDDKVLVKEDPSDPIMVIQPEKLDEVEKAARAVESGKFTEKFDSAYTKKTPGKGEVPAQPKTAYDKTHTDFDLKILYGPVMQRMIASMITT